jgi:hypothetical protein
MSCGKLTEISTFGTSLNLNKFVFEITPRKGSDHLIALLGRILIISNPDDVHENTRVRESDLWSHILDNAGRGVQGDCFPDQIRFWLRDAPRLRNSRAASAPSISNRFVSI